MVRVCITDGLREQLRSPTRPSWVDATVRRLANLVRCEESADQLKKLQGVEDWWEARVSDSDRLLLTLGQVDGEQIWVAHSIQAHDDAAATARSAGHGSEWAAVCKGRLFVVPDAVLSDADSFRDWVLRDERELPLLLSPQQRKVVVDDAIIRLEGVPGSGKTLSLVHRLHADTADGAWACYCTASRSLVADARRVARSLPRQDGAGPILFAEMRDLAGAFARDRGPVGSGTLDGQLDSVAGCFLEADPSCAQKFDKWYRNRPRAQRILPTQAAWTEVRGVLRGRKSALFHGRQGVLPLEEYLALGERKTAVPSPQREQFHQLARRWTEHLRDEGLLDDMDLVAAAMENVRRWEPEEIRLRLAWLLRRSGLRVGERPERSAAALEAVLRNRCAGFVVDEVQDLTVLEVDLLRQIADKVAGETSRRAVFLGAGDGNQCIHPTGFDWADSFGSAPTLELTSSYRSGRPLTEFAHRILTAIKAPAIHPFSKEGRIQWSALRLWDSPFDSGRAPARLARDETDLEKMLDSLPDTTDFVVLCRPSRHHQLVERLGAAKAVLLDDFKGLERKRVIVYRFFSEREDFWRALMDGEAYDLVTALNEVNRLFVAATRATSELVFLDEHSDPAPWDRFGLQRCFRSDFCWESFVEELQSGSRNWALIAEEYERQGNYRSALDAYERAEEVAKAARCRAKLLEQAEDYNEALRLYEEFGFKVDAAQLQDRLLKRGAAGQEAAQLEALGEFAAAAERWESVEAFSEAGRCFFLANDPKAALRCYRMVSEEAARDASAHWASGLAQRLVETLRALGA